MTEIMQSEKKDKQKDKERDKKSKDTMFNRKASMWLGDSTEVPLGDGSEVPLSIDTLPETPKTVTPPDTPLATSPVKVRARAYVCWLQTLNCCLLAADIELDRGRT